MAVETPQPPTTAAERQAKYRENQREQGRVRRNIWATPEEWQAIEDLLKRLREQSESLTE